MSAYEDIHIFKDEHEKAYDLLVDITIKRCAVSLAKSLHCINCPVNCKWGDDTPCAVALTEWLRRNVKR